MTPEFPHPWGGYMRLQTTLNSTPQVSNHSWGLEAGLDALLAVTVKSDAESSTAIATAQRRERHRARLRRIYPSDLEPTVDQPASIEARIELGHVQRQLAAPDWQLISSVAMGEDYQAIAKTIGTTPGSLRIRVMRIRQSLTRMAA